MSKFEETIIPLIDDSIWTIDLTSTAGFVDSYTSDPDKPSTDAELFLMYKCDKNNEYTRSRMVRFEKSKYLKRIYVKYINSTPYYIYSFWIKPEVKKLYSGVIHLNATQKARILQFWGPCEVVDSILSNNTCLFDIEHKMPLEDYRESPFEKMGLKVTKKGAIS